MNKLIKNTWDAVNELRGDLALSEHEKNHTHLVSCRSGTVVYSVYVSDVRSDLVVCTIAEFNALVEEMATNFGECPIVDCELYQSADKALLKKETEVDYTSLEFWKDAPEGKNFALLNERKGLKEFFTKKPFKDSDVSESACWLNHDNGKRHLRRYWKLIGRPQPTPTETPEEKEALDSIANKPLVYTQEMEDNSELPSVGMECMAYIYADTSKQGNPMNSWVDGEFIGKCKASNGGFCFVFKAKDDIQHVINANSHFKPIDTRTKKEKAINEIFNNRVWGNNIELLGSAYDEWVGE